MKYHKSGKNEAIHGYRDTHIFTVRAVTALVFVLLLTLALVARLVYLQVLSHEHFTTLSQKNRVTIYPVPPIRGLIYDRNGVILAENIPTFRLELIPERITDLDATITELRKLLPIDDSAVERFYRERKRKRSFNSIPLLFQLSDEEVATFAVNRYRFPGVDIKAGLTRHYPTGPLMAHVVGYVGRISEADLKTIDNANYRGSTHIGKTGIERSYEASLHGTVGYQQVETDVLGRKLRILDQTAPIPGQNLHLSIDAHLQQVATEAFAGENGALVALDPNNGEVLALVSMPNYDPNLFVSGIKSKDYSELRDSLNRPLFNRAIKGQYPPGSTIKPFIALAGLELGKIDKNSGIFCHGAYFPEFKSKRPYRDWKRSGHGWTDLEKSIVESCDVYYYELAYRLGIDRISSFLERFGFGNRTGVNLPGEATGLLPSREWKRRNKQQPWYPGETLITGIGQGYTLATPLQLAVTTATLAADGKHLQPTLIHSIEYPDTGQQEPQQIKLVNNISIIDRYNWSTVKQAMTQVVHGPHGTARRIADKNYRIAGKTGTSQVFGLKKDEKYNAKELAKKLHDHALFIAFAPADNPRIVVAVIVENGGSGGAVASPVAGKVISAFMERKTK
ncbi:MAG TPA: penicillin-binding protein 2 [Gammaproteobacteria bacterium]|nr:penicillin-binding protein 2 [Gammaproteobacteria bacterium]